MQYQYLCINISVKHEINSIAREKNQNLSNKYIIEKRYTNSTEHVAALRPIQQFNKYIILNQ